MKKLLKPLLIVTLIICSFYLITRNAAIVFRSPANINTEDDILYKKGIEQINKQLGPIIAPEDAPHLYHFIQPIFDRLDQSMKKMRFEIRKEKDLTSGKNGPIPYTINELLIVQSEEINAITINVLNNPLNLTMPYYQNQHNLVAITTGLLSKLVEETIGYDLRYINIKIAGALAHELSHHLHKPALSSQGVEELTDQMAISLLNNAQYSSTSLYHTTLSLTNNNISSKNALDAINSYANGHPAIELRNTSNLLYGMAISFEQGEEEKEYIIISKNTIEELRNFEINDAQKFNDLNHAMYTLKANINLDNPDKILKTLPLFLKYISTINPSEFSNPEISMIADYLIQISNKQINGSSKINEIIKKTPLLKDPRYLKIVHQKIKLNDFNFYSTWKLWPLFSIEDFFKLYKTKISMLYLTNDKKTQAFVSEYVTGLDNDLKHSFSKHDFIQAFLSNFKNDIKILDANFWWPIFSKRFSVFKNIYQLKPKKVQPLPFEPEFAQFLWRHRIDILKSEFILDAQKALDWKYIIQEAGGSNQELKESINEIIKNFSIKDIPNYQEDLVGKTNQEKALLALMDKNNTLEKRTPKLWINQHFINLIEQYFDHSSFEFSYLTQLAYLHNPDLFRNRFKEMLSKELSSIPLKSITSEKVLFAVKKILFLIQGGDKYPATECYDLLMRALKSLNLSNIQKEELINNLFLNKNHPLLFLYKAGRPIRETINTLTPNRHASDNYYLSNKIITWTQYNNKESSILNFLNTPADLLFIESFFETKNLWPKRLEILEMALRNGGTLHISQLLSLILKDLKTMPSDLYLPFWKIITNHKTFSGALSLSQLQEFMSKEAIIDPQHFKDNLELFKLMTQKNPGHYTDLFFEKYLMSFSNQQDALSPIVLTKRRITSNKILSFYLEKELKKAKDIFKNNPDYIILDSSPNHQHLPLGPRPLTNNFFTRHQIKGRGEKELINYIVEKMPEKSKERDLLIEKTVWDFKIEDLSLLSFFEEYKSYSKTSIHYLEINKLSLISSYLERLNDKNRLKLFDYIFKKGRIPFPHSVLTNSIMDFDHLMNLSQKNFNREKFNTHEELISFLKEHIDFFATSDDLEKKTFFYNLLLRKKINHDPSFAISIIREYLEYSPDSNPEKILLAYLRSNKPEKTSGILAYLLAQKGMPEGTRIIDQFLVFRSIGVKAGQFASIWKIFDQITNKELEALKDHAPPISKYEILKRLANEMSNDDFKKVKEIKRIIGSASIKTVIEVELKDGRIAVVAIKNENIVKQIISNLLSARKFLKELETENIEFPLAFADNFINAMEEIVLEEVSFENERKLIKIQNDSYTKMSSSLKTENFSLNLVNHLDDFRPTPNIIVYNMAEGVSFNQVTDQKTKKLTGKIIVQSAIRQYFDHGIFDPDRHAGNYLIDEKNQKINIIDVGQSLFFNRHQNFSQDERANMVQFLLAVKNQKLPAFIHYYQKIGVGLYHLSKEEKKNLEKILISPASFEDRLIQSVSYLGDKGGKLSSKNIFMLKGLLVLNREKYVSTSDFEKILEGEIQRFIKSELKKSFNDKNIRSCFQLIGLIIKNAVFR